MPGHVARKRDAVFLIGTKTRAKLAFKHIYVILWNIHEKFIWINLFKVGILCWNIYSCIQVRSSWELVLRWMTAWHHFPSIYFTSLLTYSLVDRCVNHGMVIYSNGKFCGFCIFFMDLLFFYNLNWISCKRSEIPALAQAITKRRANVEGKLYIIYRQMSRLPWYKIRFKYFHYFSAYSELLLGYLNDNTLSSSKELEPLESF